MITWARAAAAAEDGTGSPDGTKAALRQELDFTQGQSSVPFGSHVAVVEVAQKRHVAVDDCGRILNPLLVEGPQHGGIAEGISQAL